MATISLLADLLRFRVPSAATDETGARGDGGGRHPEARSRCVALFRWRYPERPPEECATDVMMMWEGGEGRWRRVRGSTQARLGGGGRRGGEEDPTPFECPPGRSILHRSSVVCSFPQYRQHSPSTCWHQKRSPGPRRTPMRRPAKILRLSRSIPGPARARAFLFVSSRPIMIDRESGRGPQGEAYARARGRP